MTLAFLKRFKLPVLLFFASLFLGSCASRTDLVYFQDTQKEIEASVKYELTYKSDDLITISVSALDMDAVRPFNLYMTQFRGANNGLNSTPALQTYLIDATGNIDFPVIGNVSVGGLTRKEATRLMVDKLRLYLIDPIVNIRLTNFKISVLGEVKSPRVAQLFDETKIKYDYIIVDTAPVNMVTDTLLLDKYADLFIYVVRANYLDKRLLVVPETLYKEKRLNNMTILINDSDHKKGGYGYGHSKANQRWWQRFFNASEKFSDNLKRKS